MALFVFKHRSAITPDPIAIATDSDESPEHSVDVPHQQNCESCDKTTTKQPTMYNITIPSDPERYLPVSASAQPQKRKLHDETTIEQPTCKLGRSSSTKPSKSAELMSKAELIDAFIAARAVFVNAILNIKRESSEKYPRKTGEDSGFRKAELMHTGELRDAFNAARDEYLVFELEIQIRRLKLTARKFIL